MKRFENLARTGLLLGTLLMGLSQNGMMTQAYDDVDIETLENIRAYRDYLDSILEGADYDDSVYYDSEVYDDASDWPEDNDYYDAFWEEWSDGEGTWYMISSTYKPGIAIREQPYKNSTLLCRIPYGTEFYVEDYWDGWGYTTVNGYSGWVNTDYASILEVVYDIAEDGMTGFYKDGTAVYESDYILPESEYMYLTAEDVEHLTWKGLCYAKNELYARHGRTFDADELQEFFNGQTWYRGMYEPRTYDSQIVSMMNKYEKHNIDVLRKAEEKIGAYPVK